MTEPEPTTAPGRERPGFIRRPAAGWVFAGVLFLLAGAAAVMLFVSLEAARADLGDTQRELAEVRSQLGSTRTQMQSLETQAKVARGQYRACAKAEALSVRLWNKHIDEMDAFLNASRAEYERLFDEANELRRKANSAGRVC